MTSKKVMKYQFVDLKKQLLTVFSKSFTNP